MQVKQLLLTLGALATTAAYAADGKPEIIQFTQDGAVLTVSALSDNAQWAITQTAGDQDTDNPLPTGGSLIDVATGSLTTITTTSWASVSDVADNGLVVGSESSMPAYWSPETQTWTHLSLSDGYDIGALLAVTPDGRYACGYMGSSNSVYTSEPSLYDLATGEQIPLTNIPHRGMFGKVYDQVTPWAISTDGNYLLCSVACSFLGDSPTDADGNETGGMQATMWPFIYDVQAQDYTAVGFDLDKENWVFTPRDANLLQITDQFFSPSGQYVTGIAYLVNNGGDASGGSEYKVVFLYDRINDTFELYNGSSDGDFGAGAVTNDGMVIAHASADNPYPTAYVRSGKFYISFDQILSQVYGMDLADYNGDGVSGSAVGVSADGLTVAMMSYDNCYILKMPESFADAAAKVDLLSNYSLSIADGTAMTYLTDIDVLFDRSVVLNGDPASIVVTDENGDQWTTALSSTAVANDNDKKLHLSFRTKQMEANKTYTITIPAGILSLKEESSIKNLEISFSYKGRADEPLAPSRITPSDGSNLAELSSSSMIELRFRQNIKVADSFSADLYVEGQDSPLASMVAAYEDRTVYFYPATTQYLYDGSSYYVVIAAGSITDLSGAGGNEEIRINYNGAYVRTVSSDEKYVFYEDFSAQTGTWASNFMFWKTIWNEPAATPASWGFEYDSTWWTVLGDNQTDPYDQAICAHSMFSPAGTADDWMMTPRLYIPDAKCFLSFDAQSYLKSKQDVLKVYIYESDVVYNNITTDMVDALAADIRENGRLIYDVVLTPGEAEEDLEGDWQNFVFDLAEYAGKDIYVLFNNNNTDQSAIFIDNVKVERNFSFLTSLTTPESVVNQESIAIKGTITVESELDTYNDATLILLDSEGNEIDRIEESGLGLQKGDKYAFEFQNELPLEYGIINKYSLDFTLDDEQTVLELSVKNLAFEPERKVVLEEISGQDCSNCPLGFLAAEYISTIYPNNFLPVVMRCYGGDRHSTGVWADVSTYCTNVLATSSAPMGKIDRGELCSPMVTNNNAYQFTGEGLNDSSTGMPIMTWADYAVEEMNTPADGDINFSVVYDEATRTLTVPCSVRYALSSTGKNIGLFAVVVEDGVEVIQSNGFYQTEDPNLGEWGKGGSLAQAHVIYNMNHLARMPFTTAASGEYMENIDYVAGVEYSQTLTKTLAEGVIENPDNCHVVVMMIDGITGKVINANSCGFNSTTNSIGSIVATPSAISVGADNGALNVTSSQAGTVTVFAASGIAIAKAEAKAGEMVRINMGGYRGVAIVAVNTGTGVAVHKVAIR